MRRRLREWTRTLPSIYCRKKKCDKAHFGKLDRGKDEVGVDCTAEVSSTAEISSDTYGPSPEFPESVVPPAKVNRDEST